MAPGFAQGGPNKESSETVARPRRSTKRTPARLQKPSSPSPFQVQQARKAPSSEGPSFRSDVNTVSVDVAVLDNKGNFIPGIPEGNFRILEDGVPQTVSSFGTGEGADDRLHGDRIQQPVPAVLE